MARDKRSYCFLISDELAAGLKALKERDGIAEGEAVRRALDEWLRKRDVLRPMTGRAARPRGAR